MDHRSEGERSNRAGPVGIREAADQISLCPDIFFFFFDSGKKCIFGKVSRFFSLSMFPFLQVPFGSVLSVQPMCLSISVLSCPIFAPAFDPQGKIAEAAFVPRELVALLVFLTSLESPFCFLTLEHVLIDTTRCAESI